MPLTDHSDVFASFHEQGFNSIIEHVMRQRPSLFNYATADLASPRYSPRLCEKINFHPSVQDYYNPLVSNLPYLPIIGYNGPFGMSYSFQLREVKIDFHPSNVISLPPELNPPLKEQQLALTAKVCVGLGCPESRYVDQIVNEIGPNNPTGSNDERPDRQDPDKPFPFRELTCFCLELCAVLRVVRHAGNIELRLDGLELKDIRPEGLENILECYLSMVLKLGILPKVKIALNDLIFDLGAYLPITLSVFPTPTSPALPFNPDVSKDSLSVFVNIS